MKRETASQCKLVKQKYDDMKYCNLYDNTNKQMALDLSEKAVTPLTAA